MNKFNNPYFPAADPFVLLHEGKYYLYFTNEEGPQDGYYVYTSSDLINWKNEGYCLRKEDVKGEKWFWAPEVVYYNNKFYMAYSSEEHIGIATSSSPLGPFVQNNKRWITEDLAIDGHFFKDDDGSVYLYYAKLDGQNKIYVAKMSSDLLDIDKSTETLLITAEDEWETKDCLVTEGPFVLKYENEYYLAYSANHTRSEDYAIGYAKSKSPLGPFVKYKNNPILYKNKKFNGIGHHSFTTSKDGKQLIISCHSHYNKNTFKPRMFCLSLAYFKKNDEDENILVINELE